MQFVNDDMDDELFRRAAEEYPLKTDSGDWNAVMNKLQAGENNKKGDRAKYLFLLALIPLFLICTTYINTNSFQGVNKVKEPIASEQPLPQIAPKDVQTNSVT